MPTVLLIQGPTQPRPPAPPSGADVAAAQGAVAASNTEIVVSPPGSAEELQALRARERTVREQLERATEEREELAESLRPDEGPMPSPAVTSGVEARIAVIDERILRLERERDGLDRAIANAPPALLARQSQVTLEAGSAIREARSNGREEGMGVGLSIGLLAVLAYAFVQRRFAKGRRPATDSITDRRTEQLVSAVEAMAIEVERIGEGQRFVTQLLVERGELPQVAPRGDAPR